MFPDGLLKRKDAAALLGVEEQTLDRWVARAEDPPIRWRDDPRRLNRRVKLIAREDLERLARDYDRTLLDPLAGGMGAGAMAAELARLRARVRELERELTLLRLARPPVPLSVAPSPSPVAVADPPDPPPRRAPVPTRPLGRPALDGIRAHHLYSPYYDEDQHQARRGLLLWSTYLRLCGFSAKEIKSRGTALREDRAAKGYDLARTPVVPSGGARPIYYVDAAQRANWARYLRERLHKPVAPDDVVVAALAQLAEGLGA